MLRSGVAHNRPVYIEAYFTFTLMTSDKVSSHVWSTNDREGWEKRLDTKSGAHTNSGTNRSVCAGQMEAAISMQVYACVTHTLKLIHIEAD